jgi:hypothetical protein
LSTNQGLRRRKSKGKLREVVVSEEDNNRFREMLERDQGIVWPSVEKVNKRVVPEEILE